jgi:hypothetical protein
VQELEGTLTVKLQMQLDAGFVIWFGILLLSPSFRPLTTRAQNSKGAVG